MNYKLRKIRQHFNHPKLKDVEAITALECAKLQNQIKKDSSIGIAVGSRGIRNISEIVKTVVDQVKKYNGKPFIIPAMGSHGGATAEGQIEILNALGISEESMGCPIKSSMETIKLESKLKCEVHIDRYAYESDGVILINRVKPHSDFHADFESGLIKMLVIGLGKHQGALSIHKYGIDGLINLMPLAGKELLKTNKVIGGIAIVENALDETMSIKALTDKQFLTEEPLLLKIATKHMPSLPIDNIDILIVDQIGKDISGTGMDPNIIGRLKIDGLKDPEKPNIKKIILLGITKKSHGNGNGVGFADVITKDLFTKIDLDATYANVITSTFLERAKIPLMASTPKQAFEIAQRSAGPIDDDKLKIIYIKDTLNIENIYVTESVIKEIKKNHEIATKADDLFDDQGNINLTF